MIRRINCNNGNKKGGLATPKRHRRAGGFTLIELLVVIVILLLLMALLLPAIIRALCQARQGTGEHLIDQLSQAAKAYELDQNAYPPGDGNGTGELGYSLEQKGPKNYAYFEFIEGMRDGSGNILNPVFAGTGGPESFFYYRNNAAGGGGGTGPSVRNTSSFDIWGYGCLHKPATAGPTDAWEINNWE